MNAFSFTQGSSVQYAIYYQQQQQNDPVHCGYPSKHCENQRAVKRNGELHRFCEHHRLVANRNQQRLQWRRRVQKDPPQSAAAHPMSNEYSALRHRHQHDQQQQQRGDNYPHTLLDLPAEDLRVLEALLFNDEVLDFPQDDHHLDLLASMDMNL